MARPKADFPPPPAIRALADGEGRLALRVTPGARVARALDMAPSRITLLRGATGQDKLVGIGD